MQKFVDGEGGKHTRNGEIYFEEFKNEWYKKSGK
jgi:hypothetical protein